MDKPMKEGSDLDKPLQECKRQPYARHRLALTVRAAINRYHWTHVHCQPVSFGAKPDFQGCHPQGPQGPQGPTGHSLGRPGSPDAGAAGATGVTGGALHCLACLSTLNTLRPLGNLGKRGRGNRDFSAGSSTGQLLPANWYFTETVCPTIATCRHTNPPRSLNTRGTFSTLPPWHSLAHSLQGSWDRRCPAGSSPSPCPHASSTARCQSAVCCCVPLLGLPCLSVLLGFASSHRQPCVRDLPTTHNNTLLLLLLKNAALLGNPLFFWRHMQNTVSTP